MRRERNVRGAVVVAGFAALVAWSSLSACGFGERPLASEADGGDGPTTTATRDPSGRDDGCGTPLPERPDLPVAFPAAIVDDRGVELVLAAPAERVVTLGWRDTEYVLALGVQPVGAADVAGYRRDVIDDPPLADDVPDVGSRTQPSIEAIRAAAPDLILADTTTDAAVLAELETVAPVLALDPHRAEADALDLMVTSFRRVAAAVGRSDEAETIVDALAVTLVAARDRIVAADPSATQLVLAVQDGPPDAPQFLVAGHRSTAMRLASHLCLAAAVDGPDVVVSPHQLGGFDDVWLLGVAASSDPATFEDLEQRLADVAAFPDRVRVLPANTRLDGGPISSMLLVERITDALTSS